MAHLIKKVDYDEYVIELSEYDLTLIIRGLSLLVATNTSNSEKTWLSYERNLLQELREIREK